MNRPEGIACGNDSIYNVVSHKLLVVLVNYELRRVGGLCLVTLCPILLDHVLHVLNPCNCNIGNIFGAALKTGHAGTT